MHITNLLQSASWLVPLTQQVDLPDLLDLQVATFKDAMNLLCVIYQGKGNQEATMFKKSTRILDTMTPEALLLTLKHGRKELLVMADEFRVS